MSDKQSKRQNATQRLRVSFLEQSGAKLQELVTLLSGSDDPTVRETVSAELERMAQTAGSVGFTLVEKAARQASEAVGSLGRRSLHNVARALRKVMPPARLAPIAVVIDPASAPRLEHERLRFSEPIRLVIDVAELLDEITVDDLQAVVIPGRLLAYLGRIVEARQCRVLVYGPARDFVSRVAAVQAGAEGYVNEPFDLRSVVEAVRLGAPTGGTETVSVLASPGAERDWFVEALEAEEFQVLTSEAATDLPLVLEEVCPEAFVVGSPLQDQRVEWMVRAIRSHRRYVRTPIAVYGEDLDEIALLRAGADEVFQIGQLEGAASRIRSRVNRYKVAGVDRDGLTGLATRSGALRSLDRMVDMARRSGQALSVAVLILPDLFELRDKFGPSTSVAAQRLVSLAFSTVLRSSDLVGQFGDDAFVVAMPGCTAPEATRRLQEGFAKLERLGKADQRLKNLTVQVGITDSEEGVVGLLTRAEKIAVKDRRKPATP